MIRNRFGSHFFLTLVLLVMPALASAQNNMFSTIPNIFVGTNPLAVAVGDFNGATAVPTGTVTIKDGKTVLGTTNVVNGQAQFTTSTLTSGTHGMIATFTGTQNFARSASPKLEEVIH
ncbi:MAG TPA: Ig-like domain-containing protein [Terriglobales bacterium]|nr:Ig-like domain-containing protein [Terriglobales bacterium]